MKRDDFGNAKAPRLLVLDDEVMTGETMARIANFSGFKTRHITSPATFFAQVTGWQPDILAIEQNSNQTHDPAKRPC